MEKAMKPVEVLSPSLIPRFLSIAFSMGALAIATGCGSSSKTPVLKGNTSITVMISAAANDQLVEYDLGFEAISLTSQSSKVVSLLSKSASGPSLGAEFMHINGTADPLVTANIPQDVYTSAAVTLAPGADIACVALGSVEGEETLSSAQYNAAPTSSDGELADAHYRHRCKYGPVSRPARLAVGDDWKLPGSRWVLWLFDRSGV
jgi:hypothetical protein